MDCDKSGFLHMKRLVSQIVVVINGKGGVGKDTICDIVGRYFRTINVSAITPVKEIASTCGWTGEKSQKARKFLSDLKQLLIDYNDLPNKYLFQEYERFRRDKSADIMFVHIREASQISDFLGRIDGNYVTLLVRSNRVDLANVVFGNSSDDDVEQFEYDYVFDNNYSMEVLPDQVVRFFSNLLRMEGVIE